MNRFLVLLVLAACCKPTPVAATQATADLCGRLEVLGCAVGSDPSCPVALARLESLGGVDAGCLLSARDKTGVRACGGVECP